MQPPIFVVDAGDVLIFDSVEKAERYLEPIDFKHGGCPIYDSEGRLIKGEVTTHWFIERVKLKAVDTEPQHQAALREALIDFLKQVTQEDKSLHKITLDEAIAKSLRFKIT